MTEPARHNLWPILIRAAALIIVAAIVVCGGVAVVRHFTAIPARSLQAAGHAAERNVSNLVQQFKDLLGSGPQSTVQNSYTSFARQVNGESRLQVATLMEQACLERADCFQIFRQKFGTVIVRCKFPVTYTYTLNLEPRDWQFVLRGRELLVTVPKLDHNPPAVDVSRMEWQENGSWLRSEGPVRDALQNEISSWVEDLASQYGRSAAVRDEARRGAERFVRLWVRSFPDGQDYSVRVIFADEPAGTSPTR